MPERNLAQSGGDQIVDGIGETSLLARFLLDGNTADGSRNGFNAEARTREAAFAESRRFGKSLSLTGGEESVLVLPSKMLSGAEALSVVGWVQLRTDAADQTFFSYEVGADTHLTSTLTGTNAAEGFRVTIKAGGQTTEQTAVAPSIRGGRWSHVALVMNPAEKALALYVDGTQVARKGELAIDVDKLFNPQNTEKAKLLIGGGMDGLLRDVRFYSVALTDEQIKTIFSSAPGRRPTSRPAENVMPTPTTAPVMVDFGGPVLLGVGDISVSTPVGQLPKLPAMIPGSYEAGANGPQLRVIWPAPKDNSAVLQPGTYTVTGRVPGTIFTPKAAVIVVAATAEAPAPKRALRSFGLGEVTLERDLHGRETPFIRNRDKFVHTMARTNPDNFLYMFRDAFGQPQPAGAKPLDGWDNQTTRLRGHATGHYLSGIAQAYASSGYDPELQKNFAGKMDYFIDTLYDLSQKSGNPKEPGGASVSDPTKVPPGDGRGGYDSDLAAGKVRTDYWNWGHGFISAYPPDQFIMLENGATYGTGNNQIWAPYYTLHKIIAGLLDCYEVGGNQKALDVARGMGLWSYERLKTLPPATRIAMWNRYIAGEYGGMNEVMARLGRLTGDSRFVECAKLFDNIEFFYGNADHTAGLAKNVDMLRGKHANQHIPQILGALETYGHTHSPEYFNIADNFWDIVTTSYSYSIGGLAGARTPNNAECFTAEPDTLWQNGFAEVGQNETCATYNMLKLSRLLFQYEPTQAKYMNYYEQALINDILASVAEDSAANTYHIPLNPGTRKGFGNAEMDGFTCCNGTALESNTKMQDTIYFRTEDGSALYVNLFIPSTLKWKEPNVTLKQETNFPYADTTRLTISGGSDLELFVRVPDWATNGYFVAVNGNEKKFDAMPDTYVSLGRGWKDGDVIELRMPFGFHLNRLMDQPNIASILYGPVVLAAEESAPRSDWRSVAIDPDNPGKSITGDPATLRFQLGDAKLKPFFEAYDRYSVYFDIKPE